MEEARGARDRPATQRRLFVAAEVTQAWAALDVFLLTVLVSLFSLEQYAQFLVGGECDGLNRLLAAHFAPLVHDEPMCFEVHNTLGPGMWILLGGSFVSMALGHAVMVLGISALDDHERNLGRADRVRRRELPLGARLLVGGDV